MDCFTSFAMTAEWSGTETLTNFAFTIFVDAIFTTLLDALFTKAFDLIARIFTRACVLRVCRAD